MGGTSTDVCLVQDGGPSLAPESEIDGLPIRTPVLDIVSVGAGGGSHRLGRRRRHAARRARKAPAPIPAPPATAAAAPNPP